MGNSQLWKTTTGNLYKAVLIFTWAAIAVAVVGFIGGLVGVASSVVSIANGGSGGSGFGFWDALKLLASLALIYGYWLFLQSLEVFTGLVHADDRAAVGSLRTGTIVMIVGVLICCIPFLGVAGSVVGGIVKIVAWVLLLLAYAKLKESATFPEKARTGAKKIYTAMLLSVIAIVVALIPLLGALVALVLSVIAFVMTLSGWKCISQSEEPAC